MNPVGRATQEQLSRPLYLKQNQLGPAKLLSLIIPNKIIIQQSRR